MPFLEFPSQDLLRLALTSGALPETITAAPVPCAFVESGAVWFRPSKLDRDLLGALIRLGVRVEASEPGLAWSTLPCWAVAMPLHRVERHPAPTLLETPAALAGQCLGFLRRGGVQPIGLRFPESSDRCWILFDGSRRHDLPREYSTLYWQQAPNVWIETGHEHPAIDRLSVPPGHTLLLRSPRRWELLTTHIRKQESLEIPLAHQFVRRSLGQEQNPRISVRLQLVPSEPASESLWRVESSQALEAVDPGLLRRFELAELRSHQEKHLLLRRLPGVRAKLAFHGFAKGFTAHPRIQNLYLPTGRSLHPTLRDTALIDALQVNSEEIVWLEEAPLRGFVRHAISRYAFRAMSQVLEFQQPRIHMLRIRSEVTTPFILSSFVEENAWTPGDPDEFADEQPAPLAPRMIAGPSKPVASTSWLRRSFQKLFGQIFGAHSTEPGAALRQISLELASLRDVENLSPDTLLHGTDWPSRKRDLESRLVLQFPTGDAAARAEHWAELATAYGAMGQWSDAALCWMNATWESQDPPQAWVKHWVHSEAKTLRLTTDLNLTSIIGEPQPESTRLIAACCYADPSAIGPDHEAIQTFLHREASEIPLRAVWLAQSRLCSGDTLALARHRDRLLSRLHDSGPSLDLDAPSFLRSHGTPSAERFQQARDWLTRARDPIRSWFRRTVRAGRLRDVGLDPETTCTGAYLDLLLAWGLGCVGDRVRSRQTAERAEAVLNRHRENQVHRLLLTLFHQRIREAQDGRGPRSVDLSPTCHQLEQLGEFERYCVDRFRANSSILEPREYVSAYRGRDLRTFLGNDLLGEQLGLFLDRTEISLIAEEARPLLELCDSSPQSDTVPRVVYALLEHAPSLETSQVAEVLKLGIPALDWLETWLQNQRHEENVEASIVSISAHLIGRSFTEAARANLVREGRMLADDLLRRLATTDRRIRLALRQCAAPLFRSLHRLKLISHGESILRQLEPNPPDAAGLRLAIGWFQLGRADMATQFLDEARDRLYLAKNKNEHERTSLALAYADVLGSAPPRIAMGRFEELFQRLGPIATRGSTNTYFTLQPLRLVDTVIRSVVGDNITLDPAVKEWLEDDEFLIRQRIQRDMTQALHDFEHSRG